MQRKFHSVAAIHGQFSPLGLKLPNNLSFERWGATVAQLMVVVKGCLWWVGDALVYGERRWGQKYEAVLRATDYDYQTLANAKWVASQIEVSRRREKLSWSHHLEVAALEPEAQDAMLDRAESEGMTRDELRRAVRHRRAEADARLRASVGATGCGRRIGPFACCTCVCGDAENLLADLPPRLVSGVITDPPYGVDAESWDGKVPYHLLPKFLQLTDGPVVWFGAAPSIVEACKSFDPEPQRMLVWAPSFTNSHLMAHGLQYRYHPIYTWQLPPWHDGPPTWDVLTTPTEPGNWWTHSCTKPLALMEQLCGIAPQGGIILDPFAGSGSTLVAARNRGRHFLGFERDQHYFHVIAQRLGADDAGRCASSLNFVA